MRLSDINLNDREEMEAARALLNAILGNALPLSADSDSDEDDDQPSSTQAAQAFATPAAIPGAPSPINGGISAAPAAVVTMEGAHNGLPALVSQPLDLDAEGLPWDERIHSSNRKKTDKGLWTKRKGLNDDAMVAAVKAELRARSAGGAAPAPAAAPVPQLPGAVAPLVPPAGPAALPAIAPLPGALPPLTAGTSAPAVALPAPETFEQLMPRVAAAVANGVIPPDAINNAMSGLGLQGVAHLQANPAYVPHVWSALKTAHPALS